MSLKRNEVILKYIVEDYIKTNEPVGSENLIKLHKLPYSSATIRNDMVYLEKNGLIEKTHTSSGRVPSLEGYRYYVRKLRSEKIDKSIRYEVDKLFDSSKSIEDLLNESCMLLSHMTNLACCFLAPSIIEERVAKVEVIPLNENHFSFIFLTDKGFLENKTFVINKNESIKDLVKAMDLFNRELVGTHLYELFQKIKDARGKFGKYEDYYPYMNQLIVSVIKDFVIRRNGQFYGKNNLLEQPEFKDNINEIKRIVDLLSNPYQIGEMFKGSSEIAISIGANNIPDVTVIAKDIKSPVTGDDLGRICVVGPTRMDYDKVLEYLNYVSDMLISHLMDLKENDYGR
jgi:heat-inducible transcriptional repressor